VKCVNCGRDREQHEGTVIELTEQDRKYIERAFKEGAPSEVFYCQPCYRVLTDREMGARLIAGQLEVRLRLAGHPRAQKVGEAMYKFLLSKAAPKQVS